MLQSQQLIHFDSQTVLNASNTMATPEIEAPVVVMKVCDRHGKKRQTTYLVCNNEDDDTWVCRDDEQCKLSTGVKYVGCSVGVSGSGSYGLSCSSFHCSFWQLQCWEES